jgi:hypothetical protein
VYEVNDPGTDGVQRFCGVHVPEFLQARRDLGDLPVINPIVLVSSSDPLESVALPPPARG